MVRLSTLENQTISIANLAVPEVKNTGETGFFRELQKLKPELKKVLFDVRDAEIIEYLPPALWAEKVLFDESSMTQEERTEILMSLDDQLFDKLHSAESYWHLAYVRLLCGIQPYGSRFDELRRKCVDRLDKLSQMPNSEFFNLLAAAVVLFPHDTSISSKVTPRFISILERSIEAERRLHGVNDVVTQSTRDFRIIYPHSKPKYTHDQQNGFLQRMNNLLELSRISRMRALVLLAEYKLTLADSIYLGPDGFELSFTAPTTTEQKEEVSNPPVARSF